MSEKYHVHDYINELILKIHNTNEITILEIQCWFERNENARQYIDINLY